MTKRKEEGVSWVVRGSGAGNHHSTKAVNEENEHRTVLYRKTTISCGLAELPPLLVGGLLLGEKKIDSNWNDKNPLAEGWFFMVYR